MPFTRHTVKKKNNFLNVTPENQNKNFETYDSINFSDPGISFSVPPHCHNPGQQVPKSFPALPYSRVWQRFVSLLQSSTHNPLRLSKIITLFRSNQDVARLVGHADHI